MTRLALLIEHDKNKREYIAYKMGVTTATVERWARGKTVPNVAEQQRLTRILNGLEKRQSIPLLKSTKGIQNRQRNKFSKDRKEKQT